MHQDTPLISVIIPHYLSNDAYLQQCLDSFRGQSYPTFELILIDNGQQPSKNASILCSCDDRFHYFYAAGAGVCGSRNIGISLAKGVYISFCDSDDFVGRDYLLELIRLRRQTGARLVRVEMTRHTEDNNRLGTSVGESCPDFKETIFSDKMLFDYPLPVWGGLVESDAAKGIMFDTAHPLISEDAFWVFQLLLGDRRVITSRKRLYAYRMTAGSLSTEFFLSDDSFCERAMSEVWRVAEQIRLLEKSKNDTLPAEFYRFFGNVAVSYLFDSYKRNIPLPAGFLRYVRDYLRKKRRCFPRIYLMRFRFVLLAPRLCWTAYHALNKIHKV